MSEYYEHIAQEWPRFTRFTGEQIVRCRDCKYRADRGRRHYCDAHAGGFPEVASDDFCAWGERRDGC